MSDLLVSPEDETAMSVMDTDICLCGKRVILKNGVPEPHHPKKNNQPRFFEMSRKARKGFWCDVYTRLKNVEQRVTKVTDKSFQKLDIFLANIEFDMDCAKMGKAS